jgi:hypothetical protein
MYLGGLLEFFKNFNAVPTCPKSGKFLTQIYGEYYEQLYIIRNQLETSSNGL